MCNYTWLLDPGHGGIINGVYQTAGKRSPKFPDGSVLYEGVFNREVVRMVLNLCGGLKVDGSPFTRQENVLCGRHAGQGPKKYAAINVVDTEEDMPLRQRVSIANKLHKENKNCIYVSVHANAFGNGKEFNSAGGVCSFHHYKSAVGKKLAETLQPHLAFFTGFKDRGIFGNDRWANFYVLRKTHMPAVLSENGFMTNYNDASALMEMSVKEAIAHAHFAMIQEIEENGF